MSWRRSVSRLRALLQRRRKDDIAGDIAFHLEMEEQEFRKLGMPPEEAHYAALADPLVALRYK